MKWQPGAACAFRSMVCGFIPVAAIAFVVCASAHLFTSAAHAQEADASKKADAGKKENLNLVRSIDPTLLNDRRARNSRKFLVTSICKGTKPLKDETVDNTGVFDNWFKRYFFPMMTHPDELGNLAEMRQEFMRQYYTPIKNDINGQKVREHLNDLTLWYMENLAKTHPHGVFHPAVRYNAMLIVGELDSRGPELVGAVAPADPLTEALRVLRDGLIAENQIDAVRVAALIGLARHAELNRFRPEGRRIPDATLGLLVRPVAELAETKQPPEGRSPEGHHWMRRQAVEVLSHFGSARPIPQAATILNNIVKDESEPLSLRCAAAQGQGRLLNPIAEDSSAEVQAQQLAQLAVDCMVAELTDLRSYSDELESRQAEDARLGGGLVGGGRFQPDGLGILGDASVAEEDDEDKPVNVAAPIMATQRRLKYRFAGIGSALSGGAGPGLAAGVKDAEAKTKAQQMKDIIDAIVKLADEPPAGDPPFVDDVKTYFASLAEQGKAMRSLVPVKAPVEEPAVGPSAGPGGPGSTSP